MNNNFYRAFEERYYAPQSVIKALRRQYLPFVERLKDIYNSGQTYDIGCGRGEWLELMTEIGFQPFGVDLDDGMLEGCKEKGLAAIKGDAVNYLKTLEDNSHLVITAFHVVEHISFEDLQAVVEESLRVLKPGGLLIMETPNPENMRVATANFYLDPTHIRPIPSQLLSFLPEFYGFARTKVLRLQENPVLRDSDFVALSDVINGASPDYAVIAQKTADITTLSLFEDLFSINYGLTIDTLMERFEKRFVSIEHRATEAQAQAQQAEHRATEAQAQAQQAEHRAAEAQAQAHNAWQHYHMVVDSNSWKMTKPLRLLGKAVRWFVRGAYHWLTFSPTSRPRRTIKKAALKIKHYINARPNLKRRIMGILNRFPMLKARLKRIGEAQYVAFNHPKFSMQNSTLEYSHLSPRAREIYNQLKRAIDEQKSGGKQ